MVYAIIQKTQHLYGENIDAYYFDIPFAETVKCHKTRPQSGSFSSEKMKSWCIFFFKINDFEFLKKWEFLKAGGKTNSEFSKK